MEHASQLHFSLVLEIPVMYCFFFIIWFYIIIEKINEVIIKTLKEM